MILHQLIDYEVLRVIWWLLLGVVLIGFAVTGGFDLGTGALLPFVAKRISSGVSSSIPSARYGKAIRSGSSLVAAPSSPRGRRFMRCRFQVLRRCSPHYLR